VIGVYCLQQYLFHTIVFVKIGTKKLSLNIRTRNGQIITAI
jgi:hypothetical protein